MPATQALEVKQGTQPDEVREFREDKGHVDVVKVGGREAGFGTFEPGWRWSQHVKPIAQTDSCQVEHFGYCTQGQMTVRMDDGTEATIKAGDFFRIAPGHDAWVDGDEACRMIDTGGLERYAVAPED